MLELWQVVDGWHSEILLDLGGSHKAVAVFIYLDIYNVALTLLHALFLLAEGAEDVLHQPPVEECAKLIDPCHLKAYKLAHLGKGVSVVATGRSS